MKELEERLQRHAEAIPLVNRLRGEASMPGVDFVVQAVWWMREAADVLSECHVFTDDELRARDERIIRAAVRLAGHDQARHWGPHDFDAIIAAAEADQ